VEKMGNYTRNEWRRFKTTLEASGEDVKLHSKRVEKMVTFKFAVFKNPVGRL
jgi:hypothetical protein